MCIRDSPAGARREADAAPGQADRQEEDAMRPWHTIGLEQRGLVPIRKRSGPAAFSYWRKPADGGGLFAEQQVSRARGGQGFQEELQGDHRHSDEICDGPQEPYARCV